MALSFVSGGATSSIKASGADAIVINESTRVVTVPSGALAPFFNLTSKREFKENIRPYEESAVDMVNTVAVVTFSFKDDEKGTLHVGFIADDTDELLSGAAHDHMDIGNSVGLLIKAVQELSAKNEQLEKRIERLERPWWKKLLGRS